jgi:hypothetical protein
LIARGHSIDVPALLLAKIPAKITPGLGRPHVLGLSRA